MKIYEEVLGYDKKGRCYQFYNNTYEFNFKIFIGDANNVLSYISEHYPNKEYHYQPENNVHGSCIMIEGEILIWLKNRKIGNETIAHECLHAVNSIFDNRGVVHDWENDEPQCYLLSWFMKCFKHI